MKEGGSGSVREKAAVLVAFSVALALQGLGTAQDPVPIDARQAEAEGWKLFETGKLEDAGQRFQTALELGLVDARKGLAEVHRRQGRLTEAAEEYRALLATKPADRGLRKTLAGVLSSNPASREEAARIYDGLLAEDPGDDATMLESARLLSWSGRHHEAEDRFRGLLDSDSPADLKRDARRGLADSLSWAGARHEARNLYEEDLAEGRSSAVAHGLGELERWGGRPGAAVRLEREALEAEPRHEDAARGLAEAESLLRPSFFARGQFFHDTGDWDRWKSFSGVTLRTESDWTIDLGTEFARFSDAAGGIADRALAAARAAWRCDTFARVEADLEAGLATGSAASVTGGLTGWWSPADGLDLHLRWRHAEMIDEASPFEYRPYSTASTTALLRDDPLTAEIARVRIEWIALSFLRLSAELAPAWIEDGNQRIESWLGAEATLLEGTAAKLAIRTWYLHSDYDDTVPAYFSPSNLDSYGLGLRIEGGDGSFRPFADVGMFRQPSGIDAFGYQAAVGFRWDLGQDVEIGISLDFLESPDRGGAESYRAVSGLVFLDARF